MFNNGALKKHLNVKFAKFVTKKVICIMHKLQEFI